MNKEQLPEVKACIVGSMGACTEFYRAEYVEELEGLVKEMIGQAIDDCGPCNSCDIGGTCNLKRIKQLVDESFKQKNRKETENE